MCKTFANSGSSATPLTDLEFTICAVTSIITNALTQLIYRDDGTFREPFRNFSPVLRRVLHGFVYPTTRLTTPLCPRAAPASDAPPLCCGFHKAPCCTTAAGAPWSDPRTTTHSSGPRSASLTRSYPSPTILPPTLPPVPGSLPPIRAV